MRKTFIIAHRGASGYAKENTIKSFQKAIEIGADMIEFDVRRTKDHVMITFHDESLEGKPVEELTYEEMNGIARGQGFSIPVFEEVLEFTSAKIRLDVELKEGGYEKEVVGHLLKYFKKEQFIITSFFDSCIKKIKDDHPDIKTGLILGIPEPRNLLLTRFSELFPIRRRRRSMADFLVPNWELLKFGFLSRMKKENVPVFVWTVNNGEMIQKLLQDKRVDGIITDRPDLAVSLRQNMAS